MSIAQPSPSGILGARHQARTPELSPSPGKPDGYYALDLNEFDFRYSNRSALGIEDMERANLAVKGARGNRLTYNNLVLRNKSKRELKRLRRLLAWIDAL